MKLYSHFSTSILIGVLVFLSGCSDNISKVQDGVLNQYSNNLTVNQVINSWTKKQECAQTNWEEITTKRGAKVIIFKCELKKDYFNSTNIKQTNLTNALNTFSIAKSSRNNAYKKADIVYNKIYKFHTDKYHKIWTEANRHNDNVTIRLAFNKKNKIITQAKVDKKLAYKIANDEYTIVLNLLDSALQSNVKYANITIQFPISADKKTFNVGYMGYSIEFNNNKKIEQHLKYGMDTIYADKPLLKHGQQLTKLYSLI